MKTRLRRTRRPLEIIVCIIMIVLNSGYALTVGYNREITLLTGFFLILLTLKAVYAGLLFKKTLQPDSVFFILMSVTMILALAVNIDFTAVSEYIRIFIIVTTAFILSRLISFVRLIYYFTRIMRTLTAISLLFFIVISYTDIVFPVAENGLGVKYYTAYIFSHDYILSQLKLYRNSSVFWEAGLFAAFIMLALIAETAFEPKTKAGFAVFIMYIAALITTGSTSAYVYILLAVFLLLSFKANKLWSVLLLLISLAAVLCIAFRFNEIIARLALWKPEVFRKIVQHNSSLTDRLINPAADMLVCFYHPFGCGAGSLTDLTRTYAQKQFGVMLRSRTSTLTYFFAAFGYLGGFVFNGAWFTGFIRIPGLKPLTKAGIIISVIILSASSPLHTNMTFWILIFAVIQIPHEMKRIL